MSKIEFECRICGCEEYGQKTDGVDLFGSDAEYYACNGCGVMFTDVSKFTKKSEKNKNDV